MHLLGAVDARGRRPAHARSPSCSTTGAGWKTAFTGLRTGYAWSQAPSSRTSRIVSNVEVFTCARDDQRMVRSNFAISEFWDGEIRVLAGWTGHRFRKIDGAWKISAKQVNLLNCDQCIRNPSIIL